ncbi:hypothetical protein OG900_01570 [Streptomyces sp. NBC_00433]
MPEYEPVREALMAGMKDAPFVTGDAATTADALLAIADAPNPPLRVPFGTGGIDPLREEYDRRITEFRARDHVARLAQGVPAWPGAPPDRAAGLAADAHDEVALPVAASLAQLDDRRSAVDGRGGRYASRPARSGRRRFFPGGRPVRSFLVKVALSRHR